MGKLIFAARSRPRSQSKAKQSGFQDRLSGKFWMHKLKENPPFNISNMLERKSGPKISETNKVNPLLRLIWKVSTVSKILMTKFENIRINKIVKF